MVDRKADDDARAADARRELDRLRGEGQGFADSAFVKAADAAKGHFAARDGDQDDKVELWAKRTARIASAIFLVVLIVWLVEWFGR